MKPASPSWKDELRPSRSSGLDADLSAMLRSMTVERTTEHASGNRKCCPIPYVSAAAT